MTRLLTAAVLITVVCFAIFQGSWWGLLLVIAAIASVTYFEYSRILGLPNHIWLLGALGGIGLLAVVPDRVFAELTLFAIVAMVFPLSSSDLQTGFVRSAVVFLGVMYIFGAFRTAYLLGLRNPLWLLFALAINWIGDSGAFYVGRRFGKTKLAPRISPGKSWEGAVASVLLSIAFFVFIVPRFLPLSPWFAALLGLAGNLAGQLGDLSESALKRSAGVKDSGTILPGHGGMLDRVDSALFTVPVIYFLTGLRL